MTASKPDGPPPLGNEPRENESRQPDDRPPASDIVAEADEKSFPASDALGWILLTTIGSPSGERVADTGQPALGSSGVVSPKSRGRRDRSEEEINDGTVHSVDQ
jgi:hypothetical protein